MSVAAHRVIKVEYAEHASFKMTSGLMDFFDQESEEGVSGELNDQGTGMFSIPVSTIKKAIQQADKLGLNAAAVASLWEDIRTAKDDESITYDVF